MEIIMKIKVFLDTFYNLLNKALLENESLNKEGAHRNERFAKTCWHVLKDVLSKAEEVDAKNFIEFSKLFAERIQQLANNESRKHLANVHWIKKEIVPIAAKVLDSIYEEQLKPKAQPNPENAASKAPLIPQFKAAVNAVSAGATIAVNAANNSAFPANNAGAGFKSLTPHKKDWTPFTAFPVDFQNTPDLSDEDIRNSDFAGNCCSYPKLAVYLVNRNPKLGIGNAVVHINRYQELEKNKGKTTLTAAELEEFITIVNQYLALEKNKGIVNYTTSQIEAFIKEQAAVAKAKA